MFRTRIYPASARALLIVCGLAFLGAGLWGIGLSFRIFQLAILVGLLSFLFLFAGLALIREASKELIITESQLVLQTWLGGRICTTAEIEGFVDVQLPTTKRRKTRQLTILTQTSTDIRIHSDGVGDTYGEIVQALKKFGYSELTRQKASEIIKNHKGRYRKIGVSMCLVGAVWALYRTIGVLLIPLQEGGNTTVDWSLILLWLGMVLLCLFGAIYYAFWSKGYD
ncbi:MAG: hypothetical protein AAFO03_25500 [Bacteroidota bacterium]